MIGVELGKTVPEVELTLTGGRSRRLSEFHGRHLVLYFYPKASTPGCTQEARDFAAAFARFQACSADVLGASRDSLKAQEGFKAKQGFPFDLAADPTETLCNLFGVIKLKNMYGKQVRGIERSTFLLDRDGVLRREWRGVKVKGHVEEVLTAVKGLEAS